MMAWILKYTQRVHHFLYKPLRASKSHERQNLKEKNETKRRSGFDTQNQELQKYAALIAVVNYTFSYTAAVCQTVRFEKEV